MLTAYLLNLFRPRPELRHDSEEPAVIAVCEASGLELVRGRMTSISQSGLVLCCSRAIRRKTNLRVEVAKSVVFGRVRRSRHAGLSGFEISIRIDRVVMQPVREATHRRRGADILGDHRRMEVLLVNGRSTEIRILQLILENTGLGPNLTIARNGAQVLRRLLDPSRLGPALTLLDVDVLNASGFELLERIKSDPLVRSTAVAVLSSSAAEGEVRRAKELGAVAYFRKPRYFEEYEFLSLQIKKLLGELVQEPARVAEAGAA